MLSFPDSKQQLFLNLVEIVYHNHSMHSKIVFHFSFCPNILPSKNKKKKKKKKIESHYFFLKDNLDLILNTYDLQVKKKRTVITETFKIYKYNINLAWVVWLCKPKFFDNLL